MVSNHERRHLVCRSVSKCLICSALSEWRTRVEPDWRCREPVIISDPRWQICGTRPRIGVGALVRQVGGGGKGTVLDTRARCETRAGNVARTSAKTAISARRQSVNQAVAGRAMVSGETRSKPECAGRPEGCHVSSCKPLQGVFITAGVRPMPVVDVPTTFGS